MNNLVILSAALLRSQQNMVLVGVSLAEALVLLATVLLYPPISQQQSQLLALLFTFSGLAKVCWGASLLYSFNMHQQDWAT